MIELPPHTLPRYTEESRDDALFHYTTATGLLGILSSGSMWSTAYHCANDESELVTGKGVLSPLFHLATHELIKTGDPRVSIFARRGVDILEYARQFEQRIIAAALFPLCAYITCFYKPASEEDFHHGLLSQWRGYGSDGGYALQFSRKKLMQAITSANDTDDLNYNLQDMHYSAENPLKAAVLDHKDIFVKAYMEYLDDLAKPLDFNRKIMRNPIAALLENEGSLEAYLEYLMHTKNKHFSEERECRLSHIQIVSQNASQSTNHRNVGYYNRSGLLVPYTSTPRNSFKLLDCIEWIIVGPSPRIVARMKSVSQMVRQYGLDIDIRPSHIPFSRS